jgi:hypothetical protein
MIPFNPTEPWSGSIIGSELDIGIEMIVHVALTSLCEDCLAATVALPFSLLQIWNQENPVWQRHLEVVSDLKGPHFYAGMTSLTRYAPAQHHQDRCAVAYVTTRIRGARHHYFIQT